MSLPEHYIKLVASPNLSQQGISALATSLGTSAKRAGCTKSPAHLAAFLAQLSHESGGFVAVAENLNYSTEGLMKVFRKYFPTRQLADSFARKPEQIANKVYANRMGNGDEASGDGYRYRGRGFIQLTGKTNYQLFAKYAGVDFTVVTKYAETAEGAALSAAFYWENNKLNRFMDKGDFIGLTKAINGGTNGLEHRTTLFNSLIGVIK